MTKDALAGYETVKSRKKKFYDAFPDGRIIVECLKADDNTALFKCTLFKTREEQIAGTALSTGHAQEFKGQGGFANKFSWTENCEESAVGRALDNAGFAGNTCSLEEMVKVTRHEQESSHAPAKALAPPASRLAPGEVTIPFGKNKGLKVSMMGADDLLADLNYWTGRLAKEGKPPTGALATYLDAVNARLLILESEFEEDIP